MRVFCPEHKRGFLAPRQSPIKCENRGHVLGELDFNGKSKALGEIQWQYCCNCEHFCPIDLGERLQCCPVCTRRVSMMYLCDRCSTVSFESDTPLQQKNFTLTPEGAPRPSCPGCLQEASADLREHDCEELGVRFITALNSCPICLERLDFSPVFPSSVAQYLKKIRAANKVNVTFDYETELFVPIDDGEFVLVSNSSEAMTPIVLPRARQFASKSDFYEIYQDYYHCTDVKAGELHIIEPAVVQRVNDGWRMQSVGILEIVDDQPKTKAEANNICSKTESLAHELPALSIADLEAESPAAACTHCGSLVETRYDFCWKCGNRMTRDGDAAKEATETAWGPHRIAMDDEELTLQHAAGPVLPGIFSSVLPKQAETSATGWAPKLIIIAVVGLLLVPVWMFVLRMFASRQPVSAEAQVASSNLKSDRTATPSVPVTVIPTAEPTAKATNVTRPEDDELRKLRDERMGAAASDRVRILKAIVKTEKQYPNDYRFPYERAKVAIKGTETTSHQEAFSALSLAALKAINTDKAEEMLEGMEADKAGDFHKLSHGHREWTQVVEALKTKDTTLLSANTQN